MTRLQRSSVDTHGQASRQSDRVGSVAAAPGPVHWASMKHYRAFCNLGGGAKEISPASPVPMSEPEIRSELLGGLVEDGDLFGLVDDSETTLQVMFDADTSSYWVEIPRPDKEGSFGCSLSLEQLKDVFADLPDRFTEAMLPGMEFESW
jgi:hypothetical protein